MNLETFFETFDQFTDEHTAMAKVNQWIALETQHVVSRTTTANILTALVTELTYP